MDQHLKGLEAMGAEVTLDGGYINATAPGGRLKGARIVMDMVTVTGTENVMMAATLADGVTVIENAARKPELSISPTAPDRDGRQHQGRRHRHHHYHRRRRTAAPTYRVMPTASSRHLCLPRWLRSAAKSRCSTHP